MRFIIEARDARATGRDARDIAGATAHGAPHTRDERRRITRQEIRTGLFIGLRYEARGRAKAAAGFGHGFILRLLGATKTAMRG